MGNENRKTKDETSKITIKRASSKNSVISDKTNSHSQTLVKKISSDKSTSSPGSHLRLPSHNVTSIPARQPSTLLTTQQSRSRSGQTVKGVKSLFSITTDQKGTSPSDEIYQRSKNIFNNNFFPQTISVHSFEKAPAIQSNYILKPNNNDPMHTYESGNITIIRRTSSQSVPNGNRWYDNEQNKSFNPTIIKYL